MNPSHGRHLTRYHRATLSRPNHKVRMPELIFYFLAGRYPPRSTAPSGISPHRAELHVFCAWAYARLSATMSLQASAHPVTPRRLWQTWLPCSHLMQGRAIEAHSYLKSFQLRPIVFVWGHQFVIHSSFGRRPAPAIRPDSQ